MILYRKTRALQTSRFAAPQPPLAAEAFVRPYSFPHTTPVAFDWTTLCADATERIQVDVCGAREIADVLERSLGAPHGAVLVDATGSAEITYRSGIAAVEHLAANSTPSALIVSVDAPLPPDIPAGVTVILNFWPPDPDLLDSRCKEAASHPGLQWGVVVPLVYPASFKVDLLDRVGQRTAEAGGSFVAAARFEFSAAAKRAITDDDLDEETYSRLFHSDLDAITTATERHIAAVAAARGISDHVTAPRGTSVNWSAATVLAHLGQRLVSLGRNELGWTILKSANVVAQLTKPVDRIAAATPLAAVRDLDPISAEVVESWLRGEQAPLAREVAETWPLRRDHGI